MFSSLSEESVSISMLKSLIQRNCSYVRLKHWGIYDGVVSWPTVRVPPLHVKREMCVELLINEGHLFFRGGGRGEICDEGLSRNSYLFMVFLLTVQ